MKVGIIGAGIAGLAAARTLRSLGHVPVLFDKGRGPGGRTSTRRAQPFAFDHGAQYFTARDPMFREALDDWLNAGVAARWDARIVALSNQATEPIREGTKRYVGTPSMSAIAKHAAADLDVRCDSLIKSLERVGKQWILCGSNGEPLGEFERLIVTAPPAQAAALLAGQSPLAERAAQIEMRACWAVMLGFEQPYDVPFDGAFCSESALSWIARNSSKPARSSAEAWVLHASPEWTAAHLEEQPDRVIECLTAEFVRLTGVATGSPAHVAAHHWRYALPADSELNENLHDVERQLILAGDAYRGGRFEGAYLSGIDAARDISRDAS